jgi:hypothetical protein
MTKKAILLVGLTRAGKSTTFNWILGQPMIGVGDEDEVECHFEFDGKNINESTATMGSSYTSVTLVPNSCLLSKDVTLMDMAGYMDKRDYVGVMGVFYFLKEVF